VKRRCIAPCKCLQKRVDVFEGACSQSAFIAAFSQPRLIERCSARIFMLTTFRLVMHLLQISHQQRQISFPGIRPSEVNSTVENTFLFQRLSIIIQRFTVCWFTGTLMSPTKIRTSSHSSVCQCLLLISCFKLSGFLHQRVLIIIIIILLLLIIISRTSSFSSFCMCF